MKKLILLLFILPIFCFAQTNVTPQWKKFPVFDSLGYSITGSTGNHWLYDAHFIRVNYLTKSGFTDSLNAHKLYFSDNFQGLGTIVSPVDLAWGNIVDTINAHGADGIVSGLITTTSGTTATTTAGTYRLNNAFIVKSTSTNTTIPAQNATQNRYTLIVGDASGVFTAVNGTLADDPVEPDIPTNKALIASIYIPKVGGTTTTTSGGNGKGTVTKVTSSTTDILVANQTTTPILTLNKVNGIPITYYDPTSSIQTQLNSKQATLVSGTNIKTINGVSVLGSGNLTISAGVGHAKEGVILDGDTVKFGGIIDRDRKIHIQNNKLFFIGDTVASNGLSVQNIGTGLYQTYIAGGHSDNTIYSEVQTTSSGQIDLNSVSGSDNKDIYMDAPSTEGIVVTDSKSLGLVNAADYSANIRTHPFALAQMNMLGDSTLYKTDGLLRGDRTVSLNNHFLSFTDAQGIYTGNHYFAKDGFLSHIDNGSDNAEFSSASGSGSASLEINTLNVSTGRGSSILMGNVYNGMLLQHQDYTTGNSVGMSLTGDGLGIFNTKDSTGMRYSSYTDYYRADSLTLMPKQWIEANFAPIAGGGYVPTSRTLTINGTALDLSANRSWSVGTMTSLTPGYGFTSSTPITGSGTMTIDTTKLQTVLNFFPRADTRYLKISSAPTAANPTATAGASAVNGSATTFMRSDAAPKVDTSLLQTVANFFPKGDTRYQKTLTLTTTGTGGAATLTGSTLNIPNYGATIVNSVSNSDGTITISPTTGAVVGSLALTHLNNWTANGIATTPTDIIGLVNTTASTSGVPNQYIPGFHWQGHVWNTTSVAADNYVDWQNYVTTSSGAFPASTMVWRASLSTTSTPSYSNAMTLRSDGQMALSGNFSCQTATINGNLFAQNNLNGPGYNLYAQYANDAGSVTSAVSPYFMFAGGTITASRVNIYGNNNTTITANSNYASFLVGKNIFKMAATGTHAWAVNEAIDALGTVTTNGSTTITNTASLYIDGASSAGTNNYALYVASGNVNVQSLTASKVVFTDASKNLTSTGIGTSSQYILGDGSLGTIGARLHTIFTPTTGGTVTLTNNQYNIINPSGALVSLTVTLPSSPANNDCVFIKYTQNITTVTYSGGTVVDGITAPTAGGLVVLTYDSGTTSWY